MDNARHYIFSVISVTILGSLINSIIDSKCAYGSIVRMITGIILSISIIGPLTQIPYPDTFLNINQIKSEVDTYISAGKESSQKETASIIKSSTEAYILEKAVEMDLNLKIDVTVSDQTPPTPISVEIIGQISPYSKIKLQDYISEFLGIPKENQRWTLPD